MNVVMFNMEILLYHCYSIVFFLQYRQYYAAFWNAFLACILCIWLEAIPEVKKLVKKLIQDGRCLYYKYAYIAFNSEKWFNITKKVDSHCASLYLAVRLATC